MWFVSYMSTPKNINMNAPRGDSWRNPIKRKGRTTQNTSFCVGSRFFFFNVFLYGQQLHQELLWSIHNFNYECNCPYFEVPMKDFPHVDLINIGCKVYNPALVYFQKNHIRSWILRLPLGLWKMRARNIRCMHGHGTLVPKWRPFETRAIFGTKPRFGTWGCVEHIVNDTWCRLGLGTQLWWI